MAGNRESLTVRLNAENELKPDIEAAVAQLDKFGVTAEQSAEMLDKALARAQAKYGSFAAAAGQAAEQVESSWRSSLKSINQLADQIVSAGTSSGQIDLGVERAQAAVEAARQRLAVLQQLEAAEIRNAGAEQASNASVQQHIAAIRTAIAEEQARVQGLALEAGALERLQIELRAGTSAEEFFGAAVRESAADSKAARAQLAELANQAAELRSQIDPMYAAQQRFDGEMERAESLYRAGAITLREYEQAQVLAREALQRNTESVLGVAAAQRKLAEDAESLRRQIDPTYAAQRRFDGELERAATLYKAGAITLREYELAQASARAALTLTTATSGAARAGLQNLGFQLQDVAVQFASGQRAGTIFAQQLPQISMAISQIAAASGETSGALGAFARFMSGPWGIAIGIGAAALPPLISQLFNAGETARDAANKIYTFKDAIAQLRTAPMQAIGNLQTNVFTAQAKLNAARNIPIPQGTSEASRAAQVIAQQNRDKAVREAELDYQAALSELAVAKATAKTNEQLFQIVGSAGRLRAKNLPPEDDGGSGSSRRRAAGRSAGKAYREGAEDELKKLQKSANDVLESFKPDPGVADEFARRDVRGAQFIRDDLQAKLNARTQPILDASNAKAGPLNDYINRLRDAVGGTDELKLSLQSVKVDGLQSLEDGFVGVITGTESVASAFKKMANQIIADLARIAIQKVLFSVLGLPTGGSLFSAGGEVQKKAGGGLITGQGSGTSDDIPAWLSNGEFVMRAEAVRRIGARNLEMLNSGRMPGFAAGGLIGGAINVPRMPAIRSFSGGRGQTIHQHIWQVNARGAVLAEGLVAEMQQVGVRAALGGAQLAESQSTERQMAYLS